MYQARFDTDQLDSLVQQSSQALFGKLLRLYQRQSVRRKQSLPAQPFSVHCTTTTANIRQHTEAAHWKPSHLFVAAASRAPMATPETHWLAKSYSPIAQSVKPTATPPKPFPAAQADQAQEPLHPQKPLAPRKRPECRATAVLPLFCGYRPAQAACWFVSLLSLFEEIQQDPLLQGYSSSARPPQKTQVPGSCLQALHKTGAIA